MHPSPFGPSAAVRSQQQPYGEFRQSGSAWARALTPEKYQKYNVSDIKSNPIPAIFSFPVHLPLPPPYQASKSFLVSSFSTKILVIRSCGKTELMFRKKQEKISRIRAKRWTVYRDKKCHIKKKTLITYYRLHSFLGTCLSLVHCRLFLWWIVKFFVCSSLGSGLYILVREWRLFSNIWLLLSWITLTLLVDRNGAVCSLIPFKFFE